jgi:hypothetical protein
VQNPPPDRPGSDPPAEDPRDDPVLTAKYLDFCSARLAEVFLSLSDERIYRLVEEAAREGRLNVAELGFEEMVSLVTEKLRQSVPLPDLETWAREYRENPEQYEPYLMGLWERSVEDRASDDSDDTPDAAADGEEPAEET